MGGSAEGQLVHPELVRRWQSFVREMTDLNQTARITSGRRTYAQQAKLYAAYQQGGPLAARPGHSRHEQGLALDWKWMNHNDPAPAWRRPNAEVWRIAARHGLMPLGPAQRRIDPWHLEMMPARRSRVKPSHRAR